MDAPDDPLDAGLRLAEAFEEHGVSYALGGALAYGLYGVPRATVDVDVNVFADGAELESAFEALESLGIQVDRDRALGEAAAKGLVVLRWGDYRIDLFTASIDFSWEAERTRLRHEVEGHAAWFLSAESLSVFKLLFFRAKDIVDLQRLIAVQGDRLDTAWVRRHLVEMMGEEDERVRKWDELVGGARELD